MMNSRAGWAEIEITPPLGLPMGGRGVRFDPGDRVLDPLQAQALVLEDTAHRRLLWLSVDLIGMDGARAAVLRRLAAEVTGIPMERISLSFSHTHSGPMTNFETRAWKRIKDPDLQEYDQFLYRQIGRVAHAALKNLRPVSISVHEGRCDIGINRRRPHGKGGTIMEPNPEGPCDPRLWALLLEGEQKKAVVFSHACHPVVVYGRDFTAISADFPGWCRRHLQEQLGETTHCQFFQGFAGNIRPRLLADLEKQKFRPAGPGDEEQIGRQLGTAIGDALQRRGEPLSLQLAAASTLVPATRATPPPLEFWKQLRSSEQEHLRQVAQYWEERYVDGPPLPRCDLWEAGIHALNHETIVLHLGGEPVTEWLGIVVAALPDSRVLPRAYTNEVAGYLPTDALLPCGGYEVFDSPLNVKTGPAAFAPGLDKSIGDAFRLLRQRLD